jgi:predicted ArsR family transcriptional regulator
MYEDKGVICYIDEAMISEIVGAPVKRVAYRQVGDPCCVFQVEPNGNGNP